jgi:divalent metal cation (Fe/Co/Zn/Cd) transporter
MNDDDVLSATSIRARQVGSGSCADVTVEISSDLSSTTATRAFEDRVQQCI